MTKGFHESNWTDQEIGFALGRGVMVVAVNLGRNPYGFIGDMHALKTTSQLSHSPCDIRFPKISTLFLRIALQPLQLEFCGSVLSNVEISNRDTLIQQFDRLCAIFLNRLQRSSNK
ncbi:hypothetical protein ACVI1K_000022 [Bradyrhizobium sp. USDA 4508]